MQQEIETWFLIITFLAPGGIIISVRSAYITGRERKFSDFIVQYVSVSLTYFAGFVLLSVLAMAIGVLESPNVAQTSNKFSAIVWVVLIVAVPIGLGVAWGRESRDSTFRRWLGNGKLSKFIPVHPVPSAWDFAFGRGEPSLVGVVLRNGSEVWGVFDCRSLASTDPNERDLFLIHAQNENWSLPQPEYDDEHKPYYSYEETCVGVYVRSEEIVSVRFLPLKLEN